MEDAMNHKRITLLAFILCLCFFGLAAAADEAPLKPYILASLSPGSITAKLPEVKAALALQGFTVVGEYSPYKAAHVLVVTSDALKDNASKSDLGAYGAVIRVSLTETAGGLQISYMNPAYYVNAYRMKGALHEVSSQLEKALGRKSDFGSKEGLKPEKLRKYHYMVMMPYFTDQVKLASHASYEESVKIIEANLAARKGGATKVYRVDVPGKKASVFGIAISEGEGSDNTVMKTTDNGEMKHTAHLPYELIVVDGEVQMLHGKFRIAIDFPDLTMGTFMKISGAPAAIEDRLSMVAGGQ